MKRRELIKGLAAFGALAVLPNMKISGSRKNDKFHFIGLGSGGTNIARHFQQKGIVGDYTCITWFPAIVAPVQWAPDQFDPYPFVLYDGFNHIEYEYPRHIRQSNELGKQPIPLTSEMKRVLSDDRIYIVIVGLGAYSGTSLISDTLEFLESNNKRYLAICTLPFKNEGRSRNEYAKEKMMDLQKYNVCFFDNNKILEKYGESRISKNFEHSDYEIYRIFEKNYPV